MSRRRPPDPLTPEEPSSSLAGDESMTAPPPGGQVTRLVLVRHGESGWNASRVLQGHLGPGLTARGRAQARATAAVLALLWPRPTLIARSDLDRVSETSAPAEERTRAPVRVDERLRELDMGAWAGKTWEQVSAEDPHTLAALRDGRDVPRGGAETWAQLRARVHGVLLELAAEAGALHSGPGAPTALVFTHGGPIRAAVAAALDMPCGEQRLPIANCSLTVLDGFADELRLVSYNSTAHLLMPVGDDAGVPAWS